MSSMLDKAQSLNASSLPIPPSVSFSEVGTSNAVASSRHSKTFAALLQDAAIQAESASHVFKPSP